MTVPNVIQTFFMKSPEPGRGQQSGFTLVEVMVSVGITALVSGMLGAGIFQVLSVQRFWTEDVKATKEVRNAESWFAGDSLNSNDVLDAGGLNRLTCAPDPKVNQVTLTWADTAGAPHTAVYKLSGANLVRDLDSSGILQEVARDVVASTVSFSLCGGVVSLDLDVLADRGTTESLDIRTLMRKLN
jgi:prepilin-type N-terminal cleavage/methylation domain-containing protein